MFCMHCGKEVLDGSKFCRNCGKAVDGENVNQQPQSQYGNQVYQPAYQPYIPQKNIVQQLSAKIKTEAVIWLVIACIQYILGIVNIAIGTDNYEDFLITYGIFIILIAVINTVSSVRDFTYSTQILNEPVGIIAKYEPVGGVVATLIYNIIFGGIIGVAGSVYAFIIRNFVLSNQIQFAQIEQQHFALSNEKGLYHK